MFEELLIEFKSKKLHPIYFLSGEEEYMIDSLVKEVETNFISDEEKDFNLQIFYGLGCTMQNIIESCRQQPLIGNKKLVIVKEAQDIKDWEPLVNYVNKTSETSILLIAYKHKKPDGRANWVKLIKQKAIFFESKKLYDKQIPLFIKNLATQHSLHLLPDAISLMTEYLGNNLSHIENELIKIKLISTSGEKITSDLIAQYVGISKENNVFELCKALTQKNITKVYSILFNLMENMKSNPMIPMVSSIFNHYVKVWICKQNNAKSDQQLLIILKLAFASYLKEYKDASALYTLPELFRIFGLLKEFDLKAKGVNSGHTSEKELFKEMVLKICQN